MGDAGEYFRPENILVHDSAEDLQYGKDIAEAVAKA
jgi:hypothetical protein